MNAELMEVQLNESAEFFHRTIQSPPRLAFVLGSGLGAFADEIEAVKIWNFGDIPHFSLASVVGHPGRVIWGTLRGVPVLVQQGRLHSYEGLDFSQVVFPIRLWAKLGVKTVVLTNAAGGLWRKMRPGDFMIIRDQINLTGQNPLRGENVSSLGPRFVDMTEPFDPRLRKILASSLRAAKARYHEGVYVGVMGPSYETAAEINFFQRIGGGAVGMSTVAEVLAARHAGLNVVGLSCITNLGTGLSKHKLSHDEVKDVAQRVERAFSQTLIHFTEQLKDQSLV